MHLCCPNCGLTLLQYSGDAFYCPACADGIASPFSTPHFSDSSTGTGKAGARPETGNAVGMLNPTDASQKTAGAEESPFVDIGDLGGY